MPLKHPFFGLKIYSELEILKIVTDLTDSQIFPFVVDNQSKIRNN